MFPFSCGSVVCDFFIFLRARNVFGVSEYYLKGIYTAQIFGKDRNPVWRVSCDSVLEFFSIRSADL